MEEHRQRPTWDRKEHPKRIIASASAPMNVHGRCTAWQSAALVQHLHSKWQLAPQCGSLERLGAGRLDFEPGSTRGLQVIRLIDKPKIIDPRQKGINWTLHVIASGWIEQAS
jgi:hypothetical protein